MDNTKTSAKKFTENSFKTVISLWFTLQGPREVKVESVLDSLAEHTHSRLRPARFTETGAGPAVKAQGASVWSSMRCPLLVAGTRCPLSPLVLRKSHRDRWSSWDFRGTPGTFRCASRTLLSTAAVHLSEAKEALQLVQAAGCKRDSRQLWVKKWAVKKLMMLLVREHERLQREFSPRWKMEKDSLLSLSRCGNKKAWNVSAYNQDCLSLTGTLALSERSAGPCSARSLSLVHKVEAQPPYGLAFLCQTRETVSKLRTTSWRPIWTRQVCLATCHWSRHVTWRSRINGLSRGNFITNNE